MNRIKKWNKRIAAVLLGGILASTFVSQSLQARTAIDVEKESVIEIVYEHDGMQIKEAEFDIYKVADVNKYAEFQFTEAFEEFENSDWKELAYELEQYVTNHPEIKPFESGTTNEEGIYQIKTKPGLYLVIGKSITQNGNVYRSEPFLISLPDEQDGKWIYQVTSKPKVEIQQEVSDIEVIKIWEDSNDKAKKRPTGIKVELLEDGKSYEIVELSEANDWEKKWDNLDISKEWTIREVTKVAGYEENPTITKEYDSETRTLTFEVVNVYEETKKIDEKLPQTGTLNWPIPVLAGAGLIFFMIGWVKRQKDEN